MLRRCPFCCAIRHIRATRLLSSSAESEPAGFWGIGDSYRFVGGRGTEGSSAFGTGRGVEWCIPGEKAPNARPSVFRGRMVWACGGFADFMLHTMQAELCYVHKGTVSSTPASTLATAPACPSAPFGGTQEATGSMITKATVDPITSI